MSNLTQEFTQLLRQDRAGNGSIMPRVYEELRKIADQRMSGERVGHTLQATA